MVVAVFSFVGFRLYVQVTVFKFLYVTIQKKIIEIWSFLIFQSGSMMEDDNVLWSFNPFIPSVTQNSGPG